MSPGKIDFKYCSVLVSNLRGRHAATAKSWRPVRKNTGNSPYAVIKCRVKRPVLRGSWKPRFNRLHADGNRLLLRHVRLRCVRSTEAKNGGHVENKKNQASNAVHLTRIRPQKSAIKCR